MKTELTRELDETGLIDEIARYLAAVDTFRAEGQEPQWSPERAVAPSPPRPRRRREQAPIP
jgi:hypothetical protein